MPGPIYIVMGVSGVGKTTIGQLISERFNLPFYDADDFHPEANIQKMASGQALNDSDRQPWLENLAKHLQEKAEQKGAVLACSALKETYRQTLAAQLSQVYWVVLQGSFDLIQERMQQRKGHFMKADLLRSQFESLELPEYGWHIDIALSPERIMENINQHMEQSIFGIIGLGVMGKSLALNIADKGFPISVYNRATGGEEHIVADFLKMADQRPIQGFTELSDFIESLPTPRKILMMVKAGPVVDFLIKQLVPMLSPGDILIDGGNSHFKDTERRIEDLAQHQVEFLGVGISGGEKGARFGPSIMPGGSKEAYVHVAGILEAIASKDEQGNPCCGYIGPGGAGHFVKMIHNGIEYAEMQLIAELVQCLATDRNREEQAKVLQAWNAGTANSYLLEITEQILRKQENSQYLVDLILDKAGNKGTGAWSTKAACDLGYPSTLLSTALFARYESAFKADRVKWAEQYGKADHPIVHFEIDQLAKAFEFARLVNHHQGFEIIRQASDQGGWALNLSEIARIWTNGCIIRSSLMKELVHDLKEQDSVFDVPDRFKALRSREPAVVAVLQKALPARLDLPCLQAALQFWRAMTSAQSTANIIQAQRDYFGAHTYQRVDASADQVFHTKWED